ncbi:MAG TPA: conjugal transfer protein TraX [Firmicutes bacterium]|nr:conjugal transfer protein TraX [Bacillota bacterium]
MTGFQLKLLAMLAMTADHIGAVFFPEIPLLRWIGRLAMPVLCFFIGEGLRHTRSPRRYLLRLTWFALLSELPFDLAFYGGIEWGHQNVYFTLALGLLALWAIQSRGMEGWLLALTAALAAELLGCDYGMYGVLLILLLDRFHRARSEQLAAAALLNLAFFGLQTQTLSLIALPLLWLYNGKRGRDDRRLFYLYYPAHLCVLGILRFVL